MGEIADDMVEGRACSLCGCYFQDPKCSEDIFEHGYPVICWDCWNTTEPEDREGFQKAIVDTL